MEYSAPFPAVHSARADGPVEGRMIQRTEPEAGTMGLADVRGAIWRQRYVVIATICAALLLGFVFTLLQTPIYRAEATLRVDPEGPKILEGQDINPTFNFMEQTQYLNTLAQVLKSASMAERVVTDLRRATSGASAGPGTTDGGSPKVQLNEQEAQFARALQKNLDVKVPVDSRIMTISYSSPDRVTAAKIANTYAEYFITDDATRTSEANNYARKILSQQIEQVRAQLQQAETTALGYARRNRIITAAAPIAATSSAKGDAGPSSAGSATVATSNLVSINETNSTARAKRILAEERWRAIQNMPMASVPEVQANGAIQSLMGQRSVLLTQLGELQKRYRSDYPQITQLNAQIAVLTQQIDEAAQRVKAGIRNEYLIAIKEEQGLSRELNRASDATMDEQGRRVQYSLLDRDAAALREQLAVLLNRYNEIASASNIRPANVSWVDAAQVPDYPVSPNLLRNMLVALAAGIGLAGALALLRELLDDRLHGPADVERKLGVSLLGSTPYVSGDVKGELEDPHSALAEAYAAIRVTFDHAIPAHTTQILQFTSSQPGEGKTTTAVALAMSYALVGRKVLLVDADLRKPSLTDFFGEERADTGFVDVLLANRSLDEAVVPGPIDNLSVLPLGLVPPNPVQILSGEHLRNFLDQNAGRFDVVIIDSAPVVGLADAPLIARYAHAVIFVVETNRIHFGQAKTAIRRIRDAGGNVLGVVLTKFKARDAGLSYDYEASYYGYGGGEAKVQTQSAG